MVMRIDFGIDPGMKGALAVLADGLPVAVYDMPTREIGDSREIAPGELAALIRPIRREFPGAVFYGCVETVFAMGRKDGNGAGAAAMQKLGDARGCARAVFETLGIPYARASPGAWKRHFGLIGEGKDASRQTALRLFPNMAEELKRKKDDGRAEAILIARWNYNLQFTGAKAV